MDWYLKKQAMVETATFCSEFIAARTTYSRKELRLRRQQDRYRCLVDPTCQATQETQCSTIPSCTRGSCVQYVTIFHLPGEYNPADILSKHWAYASVWQTMTALLFARGDTSNLLDDECGEE